MLNVFFNLIARYLVIPVNKADISILFIRFIFLNIISLFSFAFLKENKFLWLLILIWIIFGMNNYFLTKTTSTSITREHDFLKLSKFLSSFERNHFFLDFIFHIALTMILMKFAFNNLDTRINYLIHSIKIVLLYRLFASYLFSLVLDKTIGFSPISLINKIKSDSLRSFMAHIYEMGIITLAVYIVFDNKNLEELTFSSIILFIILGSFLPLISRFYFANGIICSLKLLINSRYKICLFRRFNESNNIKTRILPIIGAYGKIFSINDNTLVKSQVEQHLQLSKDIMSETNEYLFVSDDNWKEKALKYIKSTNLIIFYWNDEPTSNMIWELNSTISIRGKKHILIILESNDPKNILLKLSPYLYTKALENDNIIVVNKNWRSFKKEMYNFLS